MKTTLVNTFIGLVITGLLWIVLFLEIEPKKYNVALECIGEEQVIRHKETYIQCISDGNWRVGDAGMSSSDYQKACSDVSKDVHCTKIETLRNEWSSWKEEQDLKLLNKD